MTQPTTLDAATLAEQYRKLARAQKRLESAARDAAQVAAQTRDMTLAFCVAAGVTIVVEGDSSDD